MFEQDGTYSPSQTLVLSCKDCGEAWIPPTGTYIGIPCCGVCKSTNLGSSWIKGRNGWCP